MPDLAHFNQQVLLCQDDAYTLAWYLLGSETQAEAATQAAVEAAYRCFSSHRIDCRMLILKQVVEGCHGWKAAGGGLSQPDVFQDLHLLSESERLALVLIDILGLGYPDAARVADWPVNEVVRRLAQARLKIAHPKEMHVS